MKEFYKIKELLEASVKTQEIARLTNTSRAHVYLVKKELKNPSKSSYEEEPEHLKNAKKVLELAATHNREEIIALTSLSRETVYRIAKKNNIILKRKPSSKRSPLTKEVLMESAIKNNYNYELMAKDLNYSVRNIYRFMKKHQVIDISVQSIDLGQTFIAKKRFQTTYNDFYISKKEKITVVRIEQDKIHLDFVKEEHKLKNLLRPDLHSLFIPKEEFFKYFKN